jgi:short-chain fatty acids transporter
MKRLISFFTELCESYLPDAFVFCLILTLVVFGCAVFLTPHSPDVLISFWGRDFWNLHAFAMQMVFVLLSGHMLAMTPLVQGLLVKISSWVKNETQALIILSLFSTLACWVNWGFGLIVSGILAIEFAQKLKKVNFGLFIATAYGGFLVWHGGLSGSIPLRMAGQDEILAKVYPGVSIPLSETIFSSWNLLIVLLLLITMPLLVLLMCTDLKNEVIPRARNELTPVKNKNFRDRLENGRFFNIVFFIFALITLFRLKDPLDINRVNFIFLFLAVLLHKTPRDFLKAVQNSVGYTSGIIIQFPFYAGIMGLMQHSGLADQVSALFVSVSSATTLPLWAFLSGGLVNFFVPSGGGQWVVQGPIMLKAAKDLGVDPARISMALAWGDGWTNMIQPFWALPLLGLAKIQLKDIMGYCLVITFVSGLIISGVFLWF